MCCFMFSDQRHHTCVFPLFAFASVFTVLFICHDFEVMLRPAKDPSTLFMLDQPPISHFWVWIWSDDKHGAVIVLFFVLLVYSSCIYSTQLLIKFCLASPHHLSLHKQYIYFSIIYFHPLQVIFLPPCCNLASAYSCKWYITCA
jgi:hypothetical protein